VSIEKFWGIQSTSALQFRQPLHTAGDKLEKEKISWSLTLVPNKHILRNISTNTILGRSVE
jgi:hypothetical protein